MVDNKKAARFDPAASKKSKDSSSNYSARAVLKNVIVRLAVWGLIPASLAERIIQRGGLADA